MLNLVVVLCCFVLGWVAKRSGVAPEGSAKVLTRLALWVALPALVLRTVHAAHVDASLLVPCVGLWVNCGLAMLGASFAMKRGWLDRPHAGALALCVGLGNTAFIGLPLLTALGGHDATAPAALMDQLGSFLAFSALAVPFAIRMSGAATNPRLIVTRILRFPPFLGLGLALALRPVTFPEPLEEVLHMLALCLSPLALTSLGLQFDLQAVKGNAKLVAVAVVARLVVAPAVMGLLLLLTTRELGLVQRVAISQAAMGPMVTAGVLAAEYGLEPEFASAIVTVGTPLSLLTVAAWWFALS